MDNREKVVKALECLKEGSYCECCDYKPYDDCIKRVATDALSMLKEQEAVEPIPPTDESDMWRCGNCKHQIFRCKHQRFCEKCGKAVKWK